MPLVCVKQMVFGNSRHIPFCETAFESDAVFNFISFVCSLGRMPFVDYIDHYATVYYLIYLKMTRWTSTLLCNLIL